MVSPLVLLVDDDADIRAATREVLEGEGYLVDVVASGVEALARVQVPPTPSLLLVDLMMPRMDGRALLDELESRADLASMPVVVMTAATPGPETSALRYPLLRKPFSVEALLEVVKRYSPRP